MSENQLIKGRSNVKLANNNFRSQVDNFRKSYLNKSYIYRQILAIFFLTL